MLLSKLKVLSNKEIKEIHESSLEVLRLTGVKIQSRKIIDFLRNFSGIKIDPDNSIVKFSPEIVSEALKDIPSSFELYSQNKKSNITVGGENNYLINGHCAAFIYDHKKDERRRIIKEEVKNFAVLSDHLKDIRIAGIEGLPEDIKDERFSLIEGARLVLSNTLKPFQYTPEHAFEDNIIKGIIRVLTDYEDLSKKPSIICMVVNLSPLSWPGEISEILLKNSFEGIPIAVMVSPYSGVSSPYTLAGQIVLFNTEILSGIIINQLARPGCPVIYGCSCATFDMNESVVNIATPETAVMRVAVAQMAKFYNMPSITSAPDTDSNCFDEQNGWEKIMTVFSSFTSGVNLIVNAGLFSTGTTVSYNQLIIDSEITSYVKKIIKGIKFDKKRLAIDVVKEVGPLGSFLTNDHTVEFLRTEKHFEPVVSNRKMYSKWERIGKLKIEEAALNKALSILKEYKPSYYKEDKLKEVEKIIKERNFNETELHGSIKQR